jgi:hypothetical protein
MEHMDRRSPAGTALAMSAAGLHALAQGQAEKVWAVQARALRDFEALGTAWLDSRQEATEHFFETMAALSRPDGMTAPHLILARWMIESVERMATHAGDYHTRCLELSVAATSVLAASPLPAERTARRSARGPSSGGP